MHLTTNRRIGVFVFYQHSDYALTIENAKNIVAEDFNNYLVILYSIKFSSLWVDFYILQYKEQHRKTIYLPHR